jgi:tRNA pseudouridine38-40 synthase
VRYFLRVEYDGTIFGGWQNQPNVVSVQEVLEKALSVALRKQVQITGAGRTDAGVHATAQAVHFDFDDPIDLNKVQLSLNALLPREVAVYNFTSVDPSFHARFSAIARQYKYYLCLRKKPLLLKRVWMVYSKVDWDLVRKNSTDLLGKHDFTSFRASGAGSDNAVCTVKKISFDEVGECLVFTIEADRFIYKMVRTIVGTLIDIGRGRLSSTMAEIIASRDRSRAGSTAPPFGLVLDRVTYPKELIDETLL